jgi:hypothetical protein
VSLVPKGKISIFSVEMCVPINPATNIVSNFLLLSFKHVCTRMELDDC